MFTDKRFYLIMSVAIMLPGSIVLYNGGGIWWALFAFIGSLLLLFAVIGVYIFSIIYAPDKTFGDIISSLVKQE